MQHVHKRKKLHQVQRQQGSPQQQVLRQVSGKFLRERQPVLAVLSLLRDMHWSGEDRVSHVRQRIQVRQERVQERVSRGHILRSGTERVRALQCYRLQVVHKNAEHVHEMRELAGAGLHGIHVPTVLYAIDTRKDQVPHVLQLPERELHWHVSPSQSDRQ